jgi:mRNA interferase MazF
VIVVSHDGFNLSPGWRSVIVVPVSTSKAQSRRGPTAIALPPGEAGLKEDSLAFCHQVTTLAQAKLTHRLGALVPRTLREVEDGLKAALDLD